MAMLDQVNATPTPHKRLPWDKGKLTGEKPPLRPKHVWSIRTKLQIEGRARDPAMFNLAIDGKLRGSNLAYERPLCARSRLSRLPSWERLSVATHHVASIGYLVSIRRKVRPWNCRPPSHE